MIFPVRRSDGALIVKTNINGEAIERFRISLPDNTQEKTLPASLIRAPGQLLALYSNGDIFGYPLP